MLKAGERCDRVYITANSLSSLPPPLHGKVELISAPIGFVLTLNE
jgi:hypothetical protein